MFSARRPRLAPTARAFHGVSRRRPGTPGGRPAARTSRRRGARTRRRRVCGSCRDPLASVCGWTVPVLDLLGLAPRRGPVPCGDRNRRQRVGAGDPLACTRAAEAAGVNLATVDRDTYMPDERVSCDRRGHRWFWGAGPRSRCACAAYRFHEAKPQLAEETVSLGDEWSYGVRSVWRFEDVDGPGRCR